MKWIRGGKWRKEIKFVKIGSEGGKIFAFLPLYIRLIVFCEIRGRIWGWVANGRCPPESWMAVEFSAFSFQDELQYTHSDLSSIKNIK